jgi:hypothetical protein
VLQLVVMRFGKKVAKQVQIDIQYFSDPPVNARPHAREDCPIRVLAQAWDFPVQFRDHIFRSWT